MPIQSGLISNADHVGLPSWREDWPMVSEFWESLGLVCRTYEVQNPDYDHAGVGPRLQVFSGTKLVVSYHDVDELTTRGILKSMMCHMHVGLTMEPPALEMARTHPTFERETHWGHGNTSVFLTGPYKLHVELVTTDSEYHRA